MVWFRPPRTGLGGRALRASFKHGWQMSSAVMADELDSRYSERLFTKASASSLGQSMSALQMRHERLLLMGEGENDSFITRTD